MAASKEKNQFKIWINRVGIKEVAKLLRCTPACVSTWKRGLSTPRPLQMQKIQTYSRGMVTYADIIENNLKK